MKLNTTITFDPSPSVATDIMLGKAGHYVARVMTDDGKGGQVEHPSIQLPMDKISLEVLSEEGQMVVVLLSYVDSKGNYSPATPIQFTAENKVPAMRPTNLRVSRVTVSLPQVSDAPATPTEDEHSYYVSAVNCPGIEDNQLGRVVDVQPTFVVAEFPTGRHEFNETCDSNILTPDQEVITVREFLSHQGQLAGRS